ncbi:hypothetical protein OG800_19475 [Streptomyces sp. NBC_00445]|uniref:hypothetical protein n=1 Tax=Streptomyces sp. NBC_00445 TaxID=2975745 RepID=UPI002E1C0CCF
MIPTAITSHLMTLAEAFREFRYPSAPLRVSENHIRAAVDKLVSHQFDRHGNRIWTQARPLLEHEHARLRIGQVSVP